ncbi:MAG TPA: SapB/AmfS family lanthipeptide [Streptosporangiaceae bacterium]|nr:SapB/AmfS family lanthipeptide [Streptosporangiaceae bacterium]
MALLDMQAMAHEGQGGGGSSDLSVLCVSDQSVTIC